MGLEGIYNRAVFMLQTYFTNKMQMVHFISYASIGEKKIYLTLAYNEAGLQPYSCALA